MQIARHPKRPYSLDYIRALFEGFQELHGDRLYHDDQALIGGPAFFEGQAVKLLAQEKGRETKEKISRNFGMPHPEGYRKALRLMKMAARFGLPVISVIDTPGAVPGTIGPLRMIAPPTSPICTVLWFPPPPAGAWPSWSPGPARYSTGPWQGPL